MKMGFVMVVMLAMLLIAGCSGSDSQTGAQITGEVQVQAETGSVEDLQIDMFNWGFTQDSVVIKKGDIVRLRVTDSEGVHGIMIPKLGLSTAALAEGEEQVIEFKAEEAGTFEYFCYVPCGSGHKSMRGQIVVE